MLEKIISFKGRNNFCFFERTELRVREEKRREGAKILVVNDERNQTLPVNAIDIIKK
jgi:hypothetical protein